MYAQTIECLIQINKRSDNSVHLSHLDMKSNLVTRFITLSTNSYYMHKANWDVIKHIYILLSPINEITWVTSLILVSVDMSHRWGLHKFIQWQEPLGLFKNLFSWWDECGHVVNETHGLTDNLLYQQFVSPYIRIW